VVEYIAPAVALAHAGILFLSPQVLNTRVSRASATAGETGLGLIGYLIRVMLLLSGLFLAVIPIMALALLYALFAQHPTAVFNSIFEAVALVALWPLASYILYLLYRIVLDLYHVIFGIYHDLAQIADKKSQKGS
jgi:hypothetical protein